jgi:hypothetical protein
MTTQNNNLFTCSWLIISGAQKRQYLELGLRLKRCHSHFLNYYLINR